MKRRYQNKVRRDVRMAEAAARAAAHAQLTPQQKLEKLDQRLGVGAGAVKERKRLAAILAGKTQAPPSAETAKAVFGAKPTKQVPAKV